METCASCGAERHRVGVLYPARRLCPCEKRACQCAKRAAVVDFQPPIRGDEPLLPAASDHVARFLCAEHSPAALPVDGERDQVPRAKKRGAGQMPHVDPAWRAPTPPPGSSSTLRVQCVACKGVHALEQRRMFNGTESLCPDCAERVSVLANEEEDAA